MIPNTHVYIFNKDHIKKKILTVPFFYTDCSAFFFLMVPITQHCEQNRLSMTTAKYIVLFYAVHAVIQSGVFCFMKNTFLALCRLQHWRTLRKIKKIMLVN